MKSKKVRKTYKTRDAARIYKKRTKSNIKEAVGVFQSTSKGGVFFENIDGKLSDRKYFVDLDSTRGAMNGDTVKVKLRQKDMSAFVCEVLERASEKIIGTLVFDERYTPQFYFEPEDSKLRFAFAVVGAYDGVELNDGDKAELKIVSYPRYSDDISEGVVTHTFGAGNTMSANYQAILYSCGIPTEFNPETLKEAENVAKSDINPDGRLDLRDEFIMTLDGSDAKDLDDAISVKRYKNSYLLGVHIADVSHYVRESGEIDKAAFERGTSVYFTDKVIPMLPESLSNGICSLDSSADRYALSAFIQVDKFGEIEKCELKKSIIRSKIHGIYSEFNKLISGEADDSVSGKYAGLSKENLNIMLELYRLLRRKNEKRGALELDSSESSVLLDANGMPKDIVVRERGEGERLIEQFMLCANEAVAQWLTERGYPCVYRIHEAPNKEKASDFFRYAQAIGLDVGYVKLDRLTPSHFGAVLEKARKKGLGEPVSYMLLRTMSKAKYSDVNTPHFGLSSKNYCHFTSPIRRYPDLAVHRVISYALENSDVGAVQKRFASFCAMASKSSSEAELRAMEAERDIEELYKCIFMQEFIGETLSASVSSVTSFGLFCVTDKLCEGLVPIGTMKNRYRFDKETLTLRSFGSTYRLGDKVKVKVVSADISTRKVEFQLVSEEFDEDKFDYRK